MFSPRSLKFAAGSILALSIGLVAFHTSATEVWQLQDLRSNLTSRATTALRHVASRGSDWLISDGTNLWMINNAGETTDYTDKVRERGPIVALGSNSTSYLAAWNQGNTVSFTHITNDGTWNDTGTLRLNDRLVRSITGAGNRFAILSEDRFTNAASLPKTWSLSTWQVGSPTSETPSLPTGASAFAPGCVTDTSGGSVCSGAVAFLPLNGEWYLLAGSSETRNRDGRTAQVAKANMWRWTGGNTFEAVASFPNTRFISGAWAGNNELLIATSNAVTNPFAADTYWTFNGNRFTSYQNGPLAAGLLSVDTRSVQAAWNGTGWTITAGKTLVRFANRVFSVEGTLRDQPLTIGGSSNGRSLVLGQRSDFEGTASSTEPSLILLAKTLRTNDAATLIRPRELPHPNSITDFTLGSSPEPATIQNGSSFTFRASADDADGVERVEILVRGVPVKTCMSSSCSYTQTFWTQNATTTEVLFAARAYDRVGAVSQSQEYRLTILETPVYSNPLPPTSDLGRMPAGLSWGRDPNTNISFTAWLTPTSTAFASNQVKLYSVAASHSDDVRSIELWVNGRMERSCTNDREGDMLFCSLPLLGSNYPSGAEVFVNARLQTQDGRETWTPGTRLQR